MRVVKIRPETLEFRRFKRKAHDNELSMLPEYIESLQEQVNRMAKAIEELDHKMREMDRQYLLTMREAIKTVDAAKEALDRERELYKDHDEESDAFEETLERLRALKKQLGAGAEVTITVTKEDSK